MKAVAIGSILFCLSLVIFGSMSQESIAAEIDPNSVVGVWLCDEGAGKTVEDSSPNGHDGEIKGNIKCGQGKFGGALEFPGEEDAVVSVPHEESLNLTTWTIVAWVSLGDPPNGFHTILYKNKPEQVRNYGMGVSATGLRVDLSKDDTRTSAQGTTQMFDNTWHHIAGTYDGITVRSYTDGICNGENAFEGPPQTNPGPVTIGAHGASEKDSLWPTKGLIDELCLFDVALTEEQIISVMTNGLEALGLAAVEPTGKLSNTWGCIKSL